MTYTHVETINELDFCGKMATAATVFFATIRDRCPFIEVRIEGKGSTRSDKARKDMRFYGTNNKVLLTGEVKLPRRNISAFDSRLVKDAHDKAEQANVQYFFTWDVNTFVLWDRGQWDKPLLERRIKVWSQRLALASPEEVARPETLNDIEQRFLPDLLRDLCDIVSGQRRDWALPPDEVFLRSLESHLDWPVVLLRKHLHEKSDADKSFDKRLQQWMVDNDLVVRRKQPDEWRASLDAAARSLAYIWTNRFIFYKALRARFPELPRLELGPRIKTPAQALRRLSDLFQQAADRSRDYESLLFPQTHDWANELVFMAEGAIDAWRAFLRGIESVDFHEVSTDIVGLIFQKLVSPETRHRYGQHFTGADPVDLINSFCIRRADAKVLDPACGSGSFLVRAYYRKRAMNSRQSHVAMLGDLFGCDVALYPAHLATLNLAAREINDEANYPRIERRDFFDIGPDAPFCHLPTHDSDAKVAVLLPPLDAVVGNPPYVRQEKIGKQDKPKYAQVVSEAFSGLRLTGRADLHCYFWPHAARFLKEGATFGFLTSGQWLDVDYGFALQRWMLQHFKIIAIMESSTERWFPDARVKTCITILRRCSDEAARRENPVRFVRFERPLAAIIGKPASGGVGEAAEEEEQIRQKAVDRVRDAIERTTRNMHGEDYRILVKRQGDLWDEGVRAGTVLKDALADGAEEEDDESDDAAAAGGNFLSAQAPGEYVAGKWGRYLRAPDLYFELMERFRSRFVPLGQLVDIRRGITSGCDAFFMPHDVTEELLSTFQGDEEFIKAVGIARKTVTNGGVRIVEDGAGTYHPIEEAFISPVIHTLRDKRRPIVRKRELDQVILLVKPPLTAIKKTHAYRYIRHGEKMVYASKKSKAVPVPERSCCAARDTWYDLTPYVRPGFAVWPLAHQYRHVIPANPSKLIANKRMINFRSDELGKVERDALIAILNSTIIGLSKTFFGRYTGTEGALGTDVLDVEMMEVPNARGIDRRIATRLHTAFKSLCERDIGRFVEDALMECHTYERACELAGRPVVLPDELTQPDRRELDDAVFELLGVDDPAERSELIDRLYQETALHFRDVRVMEIQKMEDRRRGGVTKFAVTEHAADVWDALDLEDVTPLAEWIAGQVTQNNQTVTIPSERPVHLANGGMFDNETVYFGKARRHHIACEYRAEAELVARLATLGVTGDVTIPRADQEAMALLSALNSRHLQASIRLRELAASRSGDAETQDQVFNLLERWFVVGKPVVGRKHEQANSA